MIDALTMAILGLRRPRRPLRVLIDGRSAAGKTTFSAALEASLGRSGRPVATIHFDDFHPVGYRPRGSAAYTPERYLEAGFDFAALEQLVLAPVRDGPGEVARALPDVFDDAPERSVNLPTDGILLVEGCFLLKPALRHWWDFAIWLDVSFATMVQRATGRDVAWVGDAEQVRHRYETFWTETHRLYEALGNPRDAAHAIVDNETPPAPRLVRLTPPLP